MLNIPLNPTISGRSTVRTAAPNFNNPRLSPPGRGRPSGPSNRVLTPSMPRAEREIVPPPDDVEWRNPRIQRPKTQPNTKYDDIITHTDLSENERLARRELPMSASYALDIEDNLPHPVNHFRTPIPAAIRYSETTADNSFSSSDLNPEVSMSRKTIPSHTRQVDHRLTSDSLVSESQGTKLKNRATIPTKGITSGEDLEAESIPKVRASSTSTRRHKLTLSSRPSITQFVDDEERLPPVNLPSRPIITPGQIVQLDEEEDLSDELKRTLSRLKGTVPHQTYSSPDLVQEEKHQPIDKLSNRSVVPTQSIATHDDNERISAIIPMTVKPKLKTERITSKPRNSLDVDTPVTDSSTRMTFRTHRIPLLHNSLQREVSSILDEALQTIPGIRKAAPIRPVERNNVDITSEHNSLPVQKSSRIATKLASMASSDITVENSPPIQRLIHVGKPGSSSIVNSEYTSDTTMPTQRLSQPSKPGFSSLANPEYTSDTTIPTQRLSQPSKPGFSSIANPEYISNTTIPIQRVVQPSRPGFSSIVNPDYTSDTTIPTQRLSQSSRPGFSSIVNPDLTDLEDEDDPQVLLRKQNIIKKNRIVQPTLSDDNTIHTGITTLNRPSIEKHNLSASHNLSPSNMEFQMKPNFRRDAREAISLRGGDDYDNLPENMSYSVPSTPNRQGIQVALHAGVVEEAPQKNPQVALNAMRSSRIVI